MNDTRTILPLGAASQADNEPGRWDYIRPDQYDKPLDTRMSAATIHAIGIVSGGIGVVIIAILSLVQWISCWGQSYVLSTGCYAASALFWGYLTITIIIAVSSVLIFLWARYARTRVEIMRASITRDPYSNPISVFQVRDLSRMEQLARFDARQRAEIEIAPFKILPAGLDAYSTSTPQIRTDAPAMLTVEQPVTLIADSDWLPWLTALPHTMIAGATESGKTTLARVELIERLNAGYEAFIVDPKGKEWFSLPVVGGGRNFAAILNMLAQIHDEMAQRFVAYGDGERTFQPLKIIVDEVPDIMDSCLDMRRKLVDGRWSQFARQLGSLAREIGISVTLMTQSANVEDVGMNGAMRKNFTRIALGDEAAALIRGAETRRRAQLHELLRGQTHPAAMIHSGEIVLLDTKNVVALAERTPLAARGWAAPSSLSPTGLTKINFPTWANTTNKKILFLLKQNWTYRQIEHELHVSHATIAAVSNWLKRKEMARTT